MKLKILDNKVKVVKLKVDEIEQKMKKYCQT